MVEHRWKARVMVCFCFVPGLHMMTARETRYFFFYSFFLLAAYCIECTIITLLYLYSLVYNALLSFFYLLQYISKCMFACPFLSSLIGTIARSLGCDSDD